MCLQRLKTYNKIPINGLAIFCGNVRPINGRDIIEVCEFLEPPLPIIKSSYFCDKCFHTELIRSLYQNHNAIGYVIITSVEVILLIVTGTQQTIKFKHKTDIATNTARGGQSANRLARIRNEKRNLYTDTIVQACIEHLSDTASIIISGNAELPKEVETALRQDTRWTTKILGIVKISGHKNCIEETIEASQELLHEDEIAQERIHIQKLRNLIEMDPDILVFGVDNIRRCTGLLQTIFTNDPEMWDTETIHLRYTNFLEAYGNHIGLLYYAGANDFLHE